MTNQDFGKTATCGINGEMVIVSRYNYKCPCLNCIGCKDSDDKAKCQWRYVLETNPCANEELRAILCQNCIKQTQEQER